MSRDIEFADRLERLLGTASRALREGDVEGTMMALQEGAAQALYHDYLRRNPERAATAPPWSRLTQAARQRWIARAQAPR